MRNPHDTGSDRITKTVYAGLCHSCGACEAICPVEAISFGETVGGHLFPMIDEQRCTECGLCLRVCPGIASNPTLVQSIPADPFRGLCLASWIGRADDLDLYAGAQSGGVVSQLLIERLESGEVDACAVVKMLPGNPPRPAAMLARNRQEVLEGQRSKYCPVPVLEVLRDAARTNARIAMVGLACHFHGLSLIENTDGDIASLVKLKIGLICDRTLTLAAMDYLLQEALHRGKHTQLVFRDKHRTGYPGDVTIEDETGKVSVLPKSERMAIKDIFTPARCRLCFDKMNVLADVTVGDPWGIEGADRTHGESVVMARTGAGRSAVARGSDSGLLRLRPVDYEDILAGQAIDAKRSDWRTYCETWQRMGEDLPGFYARVASKAPSRRRSASRHQRHLEAARDLNSYGSRDALLRHAQREVRMRKVRGYLSRSLSRARRLITKSR